MNKIRSAIFNIVLVLWCIIAPLIFLPLTLLGPRGTLFAAKMWAWLAIFLARIICGIKYEVRGKKFIPDFPCIIASKHQSAWETMAFFFLLKRPVFILKKELLLIPFLNIFIYMLGSIRLDRSGGAMALKKMVKSAAKKIKEGKQVIIFPEGTRTRIGEKKEYRGGAYMVYADGNIKVVPVALNSGLYWPKNSFVKKPGKVIVEFLPHIEPGLSRKDFMKKLEEQIESSSAKLLNK